MPDDPVWMLKAMLIPAVAAAVVGIAVRILLKREVGWAIGVGAAFGAAYVIAIRKPDVPPVQAADWLPVFVAPGTVIVALLASLCRSWRLLVLPWLVRVALVLVIPWLMLRSRTNEIIMPEDQLWPMGRLLAWMAGFAVIAVVGELSLTLLSRRAAGRDGKVTAVVFWPWLMMGIVCGAAGLTQIYSYNLTGGQHGLVLSGITIGVTVIAFIAHFMVKPKDGRDAPLLVETAWLILASILLIGFVYNAEMQWHNVAILAAAPHAAWIGELPVVRRWKPLMNVAFRLVIVCAILAAAVVPTARSYIASQEAGSSTTDDSTDDLYQYYEQQ